MQGPDPRLIVVTGGAGFIGSHTVGRLLEQGHRVVVLDDFSTGKRENLAAWDGHDALQVIETDVTVGIAAPLQPVLSRHGPAHGIIHLAAQTSVVRSIEQNPADVRANYLATVHVLEHAREAGATRVVFTSSSAVYGDVAALPVSETSPTTPLSPYGIHKRASELQLQYGWHVHGVGTTALRLFNVYGPRQDPGSPYSGVISIFLDRASRDEPLRIYGDGEQTRDFVYVGDVAWALVTACFSDAARGAVLNIGTGRRITVNELARQCQACFDATAPLEHLEARPGEIRHSEADITRAREVLGFAPRTDIATGLGRTAEWYASRGTG